MALELKDDGEITQVTDKELMGDGIEGVVYSVRHITTEKHRAVVRQHTRTVPNKRTHQMEKETDWEAVSDALFDYALADWSGVVAKGAAVPCAPPFKAKLDGPRRTALLERAGMNEAAAAEERRQDSFRPPA